MPLGRKETELSRVGVGGVKLLEVVDSDIVGEDEVEWI
jgi:hypothetical protein